MQFGIWSAFFFCHARSEYSSFSFFFFCSRCSWQQMPFFSPTLSNTPNDLFLVSIAEPLLRSSLNFTSAFVFFFSKCGVLFCLCLFCADCEDLCLSLFVFFFFSSDPDLHLIVFFLIRFFFFFTANSAWLETKKRWENGTFTVEDTNVTAATFLWN